MHHDFTAEDRTRIAQGIRAKYVKVASSPQGLFKYPTGLAGLRALHYDPEILRALPESALESFCGVGNPFSLGALHEGERVLDIGCGAGVDAMIAATMVGPTGWVEGIDMSPEMLAKAKEHLRASGLANTSFQDSSAEDLPFPDQTFDVVISSGVFNLVPDKVRALREVYRVLKAGGRLMVADQVMADDITEDITTRVDNWAG